MIIFEKETARVVKFLDRDGGAGSVWQGLRRVHFMNGDSAEASDVGTLVRCGRRHKGPRPMFHADGCRFEHREAKNPSPRRARPRRRPTGPP